jgi:hypothetical protein
MTPYHKRHPYWDQTKRWPLPPDGGARLRSAIYRLCKAHTKDDPEVGFTVDRMANIGPFSQISVADYILAWRRLRRYVGLPTEREDYE